MFTCLDNEGVENIEDEFIVVQQKKRRSKTGKPDAENATVHRDNRGNRIVNR